MLSVARANARFAVSVWLLSNYNKLYYYFQIYPKINCVKNQSTAKIYSENKCEELKKKKWRKGGAHARKQQYSRTHKQINQRDYRRTR